MVAGATGIDLVALVVAADEGVMPQTREHLEICELLKVKQGIVILTKTDLVEDADWLELVKEDIQDFLQGTFLASAPIISVSAVTGDGLDSLLNHLQSLCDAVEARSSSGDFRLAVDRVFTMKGFGTVITGTAISGKVKTGSTLFVYPQMLKTKVRGIQVHNREVSEAVSGQRTAINLQGLEKAALERGNVLATPESLIASFMVDVRLQHLETAPRVLKNRAKVRLHGYAQVRMDRPVVVRSGDRFVLRSYSPMRTIGGGQILHPAPKKRKRMVADTLESLAILQKGESGAMAELYLRDAGFTGIGERELSTLANITVKQLRRLLQELMSRGEVIQFDRETPRFVHRDVLRTLTEVLLGQLDEFHRREPLRSGINKEELFGRLPRGVDGKLFNELIQRLVRQGELVQVALAGKQEEAREKLEAIYQGAGLQPPFFREVAQSLGVSDGEARQILQWMLQQGLLVKVKEDMYFHNAVLEDLKRRLLDVFQQQEEITTSQFKELTQTSRKYTIPLLEFLDGVRFTIRVGDVRRLRQKKQPG
jgi:selenocysteine-specific elongation factor